MEDKFLSRLESAERQDELNFIENMNELYFIIEPISKGKFSEVLRACRKCDKTQVAMKMMRNTKDNLILYNNEIHILNFIAMHEDVSGNIISKIQDAMSKKYLIIILELGESSLRCMMNKKLTVYKVADYTKQIAAGIRYMHSIKIAHRDMKPENILVCEKDCLKICDFGFAKLCECKLHTLCGTIPYMAPELFGRCTQGYDGLPVDIWALGVIVFEMLHARLPFMDVSLQGIKRKIKKADHFPYRIGLSKVFQSLMDDCFITSADNRPTCQIIKVPVPKNQKVKFAKDKNNIST